MCQTKFHIYIFVEYSRNSATFTWVHHNTSKKITSICWQNHPSCEDFHTQALKIPPSNVVCTSRPPSKLWMLVCLLLLEGMKRRFVFISRFSIASGLASGAVVVPFPVNMSVCVCWCEYVCVTVCVCKWVNASCIGVCVSCGCVCVHICLCACLCVSPLAWRRLYRPEQNSLVESSYHRAMLGEERRRRVRGDDKWLGHTSRN